MSEGKNEAGDEILGVTSSGTVITEELAEQWATEFENEDFDPAEWDRRCLIRLFPDDTTGPVVAFQFSPSDFDALKKCAKEEGRSPIDLLREAIDS